MGIFSIFKKKELFGKSPHEIFPDIMHWRVGDKLAEPGNSRNHAFYSYDGVNEDGEVFVSYFDGTKYVLDIHDMKKWNNCSFLNREVDNKKKSTKEYMQLMRDFQSAYNEIKSDH